MKNKIIGMSALCAVLLAGCGGAPIQNSKLDSAQAIYTQAQASTEIAETPSAQVYLHKAGEALAQAKTAESTEQVEHFAHIAEQQAKIALEMGKRKAAEREVDDLSKEKNATVLDAREKEITQAKIEAEARAKEAELRAREAEIALEKSRELERQLAELQAKQTERGMVLTLGDVLFETGKANLTAGAMSTLDRLGAFMQQYPEKKLLIEGHTDSRGSDDFNMELSRNRANAVYSSLMSRGIATERMSTVGYGESRPMASNDSESGQQQNRRVEVIIQ